MKFFTFAALATLATSAIAAPVDWEQFTKAMEADWQKLKSGNGNSTSFPMHPRPHHHHHHPSGSASASVSASHSHAHPSAPVSASGTVLSSVSSAPSKSISVPASATSVSITASTTLPTGTDTCGGDDPNPITTTIVLSSTVTSSSIQATSKPSSVPASSLASTSVVHASSSAFSASASVVHVSSSASSASAASAAPSASASSSSSFQDAFLTSHNAIRAKKGAQPLKWNQQLADTAQAWANKCEFQHSGGQFGENLAAGSGAFTATNGVDMWTDEESQYNPSNPQASHYTQVVWKDSTELGCAITTCAPGKIFDSSFGSSTFVVCEYNPPGNVGGEYSENVEA